MWQKNHLIVEQKRFSKKLIFFFFFKFPCFHFIKHIYFRSSTIQQKHSYQLKVVVFFILKVFSFLLIVLPFLSSSALHRTCTLTSTASCRWAAACWSPVTTPPSRSSRSQVSWSRSGKRSPQRSMNAARYQKCQPASIRSATR